ncbi:MBL fold metallo-hydrolase [Aestuariicella hydrocarbonica]|uniref:MBL fold metallo-hydrolase n=1 Tax=Pseudomaricurvus hydrocarbonicus TaxID=1470433 RepID=A0A9E5T4W8_9GAMM|nr:MBL fold metallo-hydrolase [Aestuariicella hydrocarbonica]NHO68344.1 MBL fold metallo-hydrolase [Aestuariicella hydrocarbonica]
MLRTLMIYFSFGLLMGSPLIMAEQPVNEKLDDLKVTLLGTSGGPAAKQNRSQPSTLIQIEGKSYLIDVGDGTLRQLASIGIEPNKIDAVFLTHLHFDHTAGLPAFMAFDIMGRRSAPVQIIGPPGTQRLVRDAGKVFQSSFDIFRLQQPHLPTFASLFPSKDVSIDGPTEIYKDSVIRITAVSNSHYSTMRLPQRSYGQDKSYSYRIDTGGRSIVFTGDTGPSSAVEELARGADVLVSEIIDFPAIKKLLLDRGSVSGVDQTKQIEHMAKEHLTPEEVGKLATRAGVKKVVLTHIAEPWDSEKNGEKLADAVRKEFSGEVVAGTDLFSF